MRKFLATLLFNLILINSTPSTAGTYYGPQILTTKITITSATVWTNVLSESFVVTVSNPCEAGIYCALLPCPTPNVENIHATLNFPGQDNLKYRFLVNGKVPSCGSPNPVTLEYANSDLIVKVTDSKGKGTYTIVLQAIKKTVTTPTIVIDPTLGHKVHLGVQVLN